MNGDSKVSMTKSAPVLNYPHSEVLSQTPGHICSIILLQGVETLVKIFISLSSPTKGHAHPHLECHILQPLSSSSPSGLSPVCVHPSCCLEHRTGEMFWMQLQRHRVEGSYHVPCPAGGTPAEAACCVVSAHCWFTLNLLTPSKAPTFRNYR